MRLILKLLCLPIVSSAIACASVAPGAIANLGPIICPASLLEETEGPGEIPGAFLEGLTKDQSDYVLQRESSWEAAFDEVTSKGDDALDTCAAYNQRLRALNEPAG